MDLRNAILRGCAVAAKEAGGRALDCVRLVPKVLDDHGELVSAGYMMATNGSVGTFVWIHPEYDYPNIAMNAAAAKKAFSGIKAGMEFTIEVRTKNAVSIDAEFGQKYLVATRDVREFPPLPEFPRQLHPVEGVFDGLRAVCHAAATDKDRPDLQCVHLTPEFAEATDASRIARSPAPVVRESCLVPQEVFKRWPKKGRLGTAVGTTKGNVFFQVDEEVRFAGKRDDGEWFNLSPLMPEAHLGHRVTLGREQMKSAVKYAYGSTPTTWVQLRLGEGELTVCGVKEDGEVTYTDTLTAFGEKRELQILTFRGKLLWDALNAMSAAEVSLCYVDDKTPIRLESPDLVEAIWPLRPVEG